MRLIKSKDLTYIPSFHEDQKNPGVYKKVLISRKDNIMGIVQMINWALLPKGKSFNSHLHEDMTEIFIIMNGEVEMKVGQETEVIGKGDGVIVEPQSVHTMKNTSDADVEYIVIGISSGDKGKTVVMK